MTLPRKTSVVVAMPTLWKEPHTENNVANLRTSSASIGEYHQSFPGPSFSLPLPARIIEKKEPALRFRRLSNCKQTLIPLECHGGHNVSLGYSPEVSEMLMLIVFFM